MININHVTLAASALATLTESRETIDLPPNCGGVYGNGVTEMAVLVFCHGSHTECTSTVEWDASSPYGTIISVPMVALARRHFGPYLRTDFPAL